MIKLKYPKFWRKKNWFSSFLLPLSYIYRLLGYLRGRFTSQVKLPQSVICVGNITVGGSGKTPVVAWLAQEFKRKNISFVIITKAYKSDLKGAKIVHDLDSSQAVGDESVILRNFGPVIAARKLNRALPLIKQVNPEVIILDDGMQNPLLYKDLQILVFDSLRGLGNNFIFPAGPLRESLDSGLAKADLVVIIGDLANIHIKEKIPSFRAHIKFIRALNKNIDYIAFAGIGNPDKFYSSMEQEKLIIKQFISFEDHHVYSDNDLAKLVNLAKQEQCSLITTEKDYVKIPPKYKKIVICASVALEIEKKEEFLNLIYEKILQKT